ncbi:MAG: ribosome small subunit-dependent GTPase A [Pseudoramibacter sp.]
MADSMNHSKTNSPISGRIVKGIGGFYTVKTADGQTVTAKPVGIFRHQHITPTVGDFAEAVKEDEQDQYYALTAIKPRKNLFVRPPVANVDTAIVTFALRAPKPNLLLIDKMLVACEVRGVKPVLCFTKADLAKPKDFDVAEIYRTTPYPAVISAGDSPEKIHEAAAQLKALIGDGTAFFAGPSGVGKSTLTNALCGRAIMDTGHLSKKLRRGKHTTRHVELLALPEGGYLFDTPGFSSLRLDDGVDEAMLREAFAEFPQGACKFADCRHVKEPGCAVREQVEAGQIARSRYENYLALLGQLANRKL